MFNPSHYENARPGAVAVLEVVGETTATPQFVPLQRTTVRGRLLGPLADLQVTHTFGYGRNVSERTLEARYRFPLPGDAAVMGVTVRFGEVEIVAELKERQQAEADYTQAKAEGRQAALATRESADVFTLQVAGLQPDQPIVIETSYTQLARVQEGRWSLRIPLTLAPRYVRRDELATRQAQGQPLALLRDPGHRFALDLTVVGAGEITSPTHALTVTPADAGQHVALADGEILPDRDCIVTWSLPAGDEQPFLTAYGYADPDRDDHYFLALVAPPALRPQSQEIPREVILLVDHSGSMTGPKWAAADWAVERFLRGLGEQEHFALGIFHNTTRWFKPALQPATAEGINQAVTWFKAQRDSGGTELGVALEEALRLARTSGEHARHLLVITDAEVTDAGRILRLAEGEAKHSERRRISVLCIDAAPNAYLAQELADRGGGVARFLTSEPEHEDITTALEAVLADWAEPILTGVTLRVNRAQVEVSGRRVVQDDAGHAHIDLGDLVAGRALWVVGRTKAGGSEAVALTLQTARRRTLASTTLEAESDQATARATAALKALFGARRINALEALIAAGYDATLLREQLVHLGYDPDIVLAAQPSGGDLVYAEKRQSATSEALQRLLRDEALRYGLASTATAFVATRREAGRQVEGTVAVANALPAGWSDQFLSAQAAPAAPQGMPMPAAQVMPASFGPMAAVGGFLSRAAKSMGNSSVAPPPSTDQQATLFSGPLVWQGTEAILFDAEGEAAGLPASVMITAINASAKGSIPVDDRQAELHLLIYLDDPATPRARIPLRDLLSQGERPLNLRRQPGQRLTIVLRDPHGQLAQGSILLTLQLRWRPA
jgi:Ca-activated chloride channel homolog